MLNYNKCSKDILSTSQRLLCIFLLFSNKYLNNNKKICNKCCHQLPVECFLIIVKMFIEYTKTIKNTHQEWFKIPSEHLQYLENI